MPISLGNIDAATSFLTQRTTLVTQVYCLKMMANLKEVRNDPKKITMKHTVKQVNKLMSQTLSGRLNIAKTMINIKQVGQSIQRDISRNTVGDNGVAQNDIYLLQLLTQRFINLVVRDENFQSLSEHKQARHHPGNLINEIQADAPPPSPAPTPAPSRQQQTTRLTGAALKTCGSGFPAVSKPTELPSIIEPRVRWKNI